MFKLLFSPIVEFEDTELKEHVDYGVVNSELLHHKHMLLSMLNTPMHGMGDLSHLLDNLSPIVECMIKLEINELSLDSTHILVLQCDNTLTLREKPHV